MLPTLERAGAPANYVVWLKKLESDTWPASTSSVTITFPAEFYSVPVRNTQGQPTALTCKVNAGFSPGQDPSCTVQATNVILVTFSGGVTLQDAINQYVFIINPINNPTVSYGPFAYTLRYVSGFVDSRRDNDLSRTLERLWECFMSLQTDYFDFWTSKIWDFS